MIRRSKKNDVPAAETPRYGLDDGAADAPMPLAPLELLRWAWRQLTSMRTALLLLFLLALASIPGSVVPQEGVDPIRVSRWREQHETLAPIYERLGLFSVYDSVWFSAIYILLMISLVGCILPRTKVYWRALRAKPPAVPRRLERLGDYRRLEVAEDLAAAEARVRDGLSGYRLVRSESGPAGARVVELSAEKGYLREAGNLLFHVSILIVLVGVAVGSLFGFRGGVIVVTGNSFANTLSQYDDLNPGSLFEADDLAPFSFTVKDFDVTFVREGRSAGQARNFSAEIEYRESPDSELETERIRVNHPLKINGTDVFLIGHGYAPVVTVRSATGAVVFTGPVVFLPEDSTFRSFGVIKIPDAAPQQLGFEGEFYPTYAFTMETGPFTVLPDAKNPVLSLTAWAGDLGLDDGTPQSVYSLRKEGLDRILKADGKPMRVDLALGKTVTLPDQLGTITLDRVDRFVKLQISKSPASWVALLGVSLALLGLLGSLFIRPRRVWARLREEDEQTTVELAGLDRSAGGNLAEELDSLARQVEEKR